MFSLDQYTAVHRSAAVVDRSTQGKLLLTGADRLAFLHALLTNDIARLGAGTGCYAAYLTPQGRMISDMRVVESGDNVLLDVEAFVASPLAERFDKLIFSEDLQVRNVTAELAELGVHGPSASSVLERVTTMPAARLQSLNQYDNVRGQAVGADITLVRDDSHGVPGYDVYVPSGGRTQLAAALVEAGAVRCDEDTAETLRIEAGRPRFGVDMDHETIPLEAGIENRAISLTKGCYVGQEVIVRVLHRGHGRVARRLVGLVLSGERAPSRGDKILSGEQEVGRITSAVQSPLMNAPIALGYVQRDHTSEGSELTVTVGSEALPARVHQLPFAAP
jgi:folate-binding protein YgfZ